MPCALGSSLFNHVFPLSLVVKERRASVFLNLEEVSAPPSDGESIVVDMAKSAHQF